MRFLHTSDWHLGRLFHGVHLTSDQSFILDQFVDLVAETKVDAVVIAGDIYDRAVPPDDAVALLDDVFERIVLGHGIPIIAIAGNHDSARRVGFGARLLGPQGLHIIGPVEAVPAPVVLTDAHGPVHFHPVPYAEPSEVRVAFRAETPSSEGVRSHGDAMQLLVERCGRRTDDGARHVLIAHAFVVGGEASDSERPLSVGGADTVPVEVFEGFDYVALGHLHRPQRAGGQEHVRYAGSLLKYSFSEVDHAKSVSLVELDASGTCSVEAIPLSPRRDVRVVEGAFTDLLQGPPPGESADDYLLIQLTDEGTLHDPMSRLQQVYPNALQLQRLVLTHGSGPGAAPGEHRTMTDHDLFKSFFAHATGAELGEAQDELLTSVLDAQRRTARGDTA